MAVIQRWLAVFRSSCLRCFISKDVALARHQLLLPRDLDPEDFGLTQQVWCRVAGVLEHRYSFDVLCGRDLCTQPPVYLQGMGIASSDWPLHTGRPRDIRRAKT
jgi:hypothetical protein